MSDLIPAAALATMQAVSGDADLVAQALTDSGWLLVREHPEEHRYLSTGCLHGEHGYCQKNTGLAGAKTPAVCKFCRVPCICTCHTAVGA